MGPSKESNKRENKKKRRFSLKKISVFLFLLLLCVAASYFGVIYLQKRNPSHVKEFAHVRLKEEVIGFSVEKLPELYSGLVALNTETTLIDKELERLDAIEKEFPAQVKITHDEKKIWQKMRKSLISALTRLGKDIETLYVAYQVNPEKGLERIEKTKDDLKKAVADILDPAGELTQKLKKSENGKGFIDKIKERFLSGK